MKMGEQSQYEQVHYEIRVHGRVDPSWSEWFDGLTITHGINGDTLLAGPIADQAVLYGVISRIRDLGSFCSRLSGMSQRRRTDRPPH